jgi:hypothetical protein
MPKNNVTDPITDQEMAFAHLVLSGTMNDRRAAEAVGLNPETAAYIKSKPRLRSYMIEHRAAVREKLVDEADRLRKLNLGRDRILSRLWELAALSAEATRGSITGQMKALTMIAAIEGLIPSATKNDRRHAPSWTQPVATPPNAQIDDSGSRPKAEPAASRVPEPPLAHNAGQLNPFVIPRPLNQAPAPATSFFDVALDAINSANLPYSAKPNGFAQSR